MPLRRFLYVLLLFFLQLSWSQNNNNSNPINCDINELSRLSTKDVSTISAAELFQLGVCEYKFDNYKKADFYFKSAEAKGFLDEDLLDRYINLCQMALTQNSNDNPIEQITAAPIKSTFQPDQGSNNSLQNDILNYLFICIAIIGTLIGLGLIIRYQKHALHNIFLGLFLIGLSLMLFELALYWWSNAGYKPRVPFFRVQFFIWMPSIYFYLRLKLQKSFLITKKNLLFHYSLFGIALVFLVFYGNFNGIGSQNNSIVISYYLNSLLFKSAQSTVYFILLISVFRKHKDTVYKSNRNWMIMLISFIGIITGILYLRTIYGQAADYDYITIYFAAIILSLFICSAGLMLFINPKIVTRSEQPIDQNINDSSKYKNSGLTEDMLTTLKIELHELLKRKKVHLDNTITLEKLSKELNTDRYSLSQVINQEFGKNFYEFINDYRVAETIEIINNSDKIKSVNDLIYESGFNNRVSFYKAFKKRKNMTPMEYIKSKQPTPADI